MYSLRFSIKDLLREKESILLEIKEYLFVGITHATLNMPFCVLSFSFFEKIPIVIMNAIKFLNTIDRKRNPIKLDLLDSKFFVFEENRVAFDIKI